MKSLETCRVLVIDEDKDFVDFVKRTLDPKRRLVRSSASGEEGLEEARRHEYAVVLINIDLPDTPGIDLIGKIKSIDPAIPVLMVSVKGDSKLIVDSMKAGASDYIRKPVEAELLIQKVDEMVTERLEISVEESLTNETVGESIIGNSPKTRRLIKDISKVSVTDASVLIRGESGTGKGLVAQLIHQHSHRKNGPFVTINCAAIPSALLETELFGHVKGAFTSAIRDKPGRFEIANLGTIFLDEIGDLPPELQVKILRVIQSREFERVGGLKTMKVDARIIAATNRNLEEAVNKGRFREDLFYRLNVLPISITPLRERKEDITPLVNHFFKTYSRNANKRFKPLSESIMKRLIDYEWPGNVRELQNVVERAIILGREPELRHKDFIITSSSSATPETDETSSEESVATSVKDIERSALVKALNKTGGNVTKTAEILKVGRDTVYRRMRKYGIETKRS